MSARRGEKYMASDVLHAKVLTVSDGVSAGTRDDAFGSWFGCVARGVWLDRGRAFRVCRRHRLRCTRIDAPTRMVSPASSSRRGAPVSRHATRHRKATRRVIERDAPGLAEAMRYGESPRAFVQGGGRSSGRCRHRQHSGFAEGLCRATVGDCGCLAARRGARERQADVITKEQARKVPRLGVNRGSCQGTICSLGACFVWCFRKALSRGQPLSCSRARTSV